jgi:hypothetical protein
MFSVHEMSVRAQKRPRIGDNEHESAEMVTKITDKHGDRKIRVHSGRVQKFLVLSTFLVGTL